jgi:3-hydroxyisobutyrate dehydrogenase
VSKLGWIGMGDIGTPMALRLMDAGHDLRVWGRTKARLAPALERGAREGASAMELAVACEAVLLCVTDADAVEEIAFGPQGLADARKADLLVVDHSTIHPRRSQAAATRLADLKAGRWVDAPVSGGTAGARAGTLAVMVGGETGDVEHARPWISAFGGRITHVGPAGCGQACKSSNQAIANTTIMVWAEMLAYARAFGLDLEMMVEAFEGGFADSTVRKTLVPRLLDGSFPGHYASIIQKDLDIPCDVGRSMQTPMPVTSLVASLYRHHQVFQDMAGKDLGLTDLFTHRTEGAKGRF